MIAVVHPALLLAVALQLAPNPPHRGEAATLTIETHGETEPLRVDVNGAAMLRRAPDGATVERSEADLHLTWQHAPDTARVELVLRADEAADSLDVTATSGTTTTTVGAKPLRRDPPLPTAANRTSLPVLLGFGLSLLMWPTFRLVSRHSQIAGAIAAIGGTVLSVVLVRMWWGDYAAGADYRDGRCAITDRMAVYQGSDRMRRVYALMYAVELNGRPAIAGDSDRSRWRERDSDAFARLNRFETGKAYPCWYSVRDPHEVLLEPRSRGVIRRTVLSVAAFLLLIAPGWLRPAAPRR